MSKHAHNLGSTIAFENLGVELTYEAFLQNSIYVAAYFQKSSRPKDVGDHIGFMLPNTISYSVGMFAALRAGLVVVSMNPLCSEQRASLFSQRFRGKGTVYH